MSPRFWIAVGAVSAATAVAAGAIGTHVLKQTLEFSAEKLETYDVAVRYQMIHSLGLVLVGALLYQRPLALLSTAGSLFLAGIVLFSGGIYAWLATGITPFVHVVPIGGTAWIIGWLVLAAAACKLPVTKV